MDEEDFQLLLDLLDYECELRERERKLKKMNCKWAKEINLVHGNKTAWICTSPHRDDMLCGHCCLDCSKPYLHNDEIVGCEGVCEAAVLTLRGYDVGDGEYWEAKGDEKYESSI